MPNPEKTEPEQTELPGVSEEPSELDLLKKKMAEIEAKAQVAEARATELGSKLTRAQQENAELVRFHKQTLPKINKSFDEEWSANPEGAVVSRVQEKVVPLEERLARQEAEIAFTSIVAETPGYQKYAARVRELAWQDEYAPLTWRGRKGIEALFKIAKAEEMEKTPPVLQPNGSDPGKERIFTEETSSRSTVPSKGTSIRLNSDQNFIAKKLGIKPEDYAKHMKGMEEV